MSAILPDSLGPYLDRTTQVFMATTDTLLGYEGVAAYTYDADAGSLTPVEYAPTYAPMFFYQVAALETGSWWLPVSTQPDNAWGDTELLDADGNIPTANLLRPRTLFWWLPGAVVLDDLGPETVYGTVKGLRPGTAP